MNILFLSKKINNQVWVALCYLSLWLHVSQELNRQKAVYEERKRLAEKIKQKTIVTKTTPPDTPNPPETNGEDPFTKVLVFCIITIQYTVENVCTDDIFPHY